ncbi:hypothetical protein [Bradyrhizobium sp.]|uniref:hypothetical protein n=1 Tax=Bradyrhizobium sp. TaxID=376 RepID=UPI0026262731|nr:hypothetical protein [Bradyrhizobium sp.]
MRPARIARRQHDRLASLHATASNLRRKYATSDLLRTHARPVTTSRREAEWRNAAGRQLNLGAALLSFSVLADSGVEHYRGSFQNRAMYIPLGVSALALAASLFGVVDTRARSHAVRDSIYGLAAMTGVIGLGFHGYNILKRPGGVSWLNLFYAAPVGAPVALALAGALGRGAEKVREERSSRILGRAAGKTLGLLTSVGLAGTIAEAGLLHFRGAFQNPGMFLPVTLPPVAGGLLAASVINPGKTIRLAAKACLNLTALLGFAGVAFHGYGVSRQMGGWRNWSQNVLNGPPLPAPPSFTGLALAGLAALSLADDEQ